jgi:hypothetical protein
MLDRSIIYPKVVVYHNLLKDTDKIVDMLKKAKSFKEDKYHLKPWDDWSPKGNIMNIDGPDSNGYTEIKNLEKKEQEDLLKNIQEAFHTSSKDFFKQYENDEILKSFINLFNTNNIKCKNSGISFLRYDKNEDLEDLNYKNKPVAMEYHTDTHEFDKESPGHKLKITVTMYLNDDYDGGEISFLHEDSGKIINYKPQKGDVVIFPSGHPYYHGVLKIFKNERYLLRMFWFLDYEGSDWWYKNEKFYGKDQWDIMEKERIKKEYESGKYHKVIVYQNGHSTGCLENCNNNCSIENFDESKFTGKPFYAKEEAILYKRNNNV